MSSAAIHPSDANQDVYILEHGDPRLTNADLVPNPIEKRNWTWWNFTALWMGMVHNLFGFTVIGGMMVAGLSAGQALLAVGLASLIILAFLGLTGRIGARFGIPYPVWARSAYGVFGANVPAVIRGLVAIMWFGVQNYLGATVVNALLISASGAWRSLGQNNLLGQKVTFWIALLLFWSINFLVINHGMDTIRRFESWAGPMVLIVMVGLVIWALKQAHGIGPIFSSPSKYKTTSSFLGEGLVPAVALFISASWATMILNYPDLTRFARSNRDQVIGTFIGLPVATVLYYGMSAIVVSGAQVVTHKTLWNLGDVLVVVGNPIVSIVGAILLGIATISVNIPANLVSPAYDMTNLWPRVFTFKRGLIAGILLAFLYMPWHWMENPNTLFSLINNVGAVLGPATGILLADYFIIRARRLDVPDLYRVDGRYQGFHGFNVVSIAVLVVATVPILLGEVWSPFSGLFTYAWFFGVGFAFVLYLVVVTLIRAVSSANRPEFEPAGSEGTEAREIGATQGASLA